MREIFHILYRYVYIMRSRIDVRFCALNKSAELYCASYIHIDITYEIFLSLCVVGFRAVILNPYAAARFCVAKF